MLKKGKIVYDDIFQATKHYVIQMEQEDDAKKLTQANKEFQKNHNNIICSSYELFQNVYQTALNEKMPIKDIKIQEDNLYQLFKGDKSYENTYH